MNNSFNFFNDKMKEFANFEAFSQGCKNFNMPDFTQLSDTVKHNAEAFTEAGKIASESVQAIVRRGTEIAQNNATHLFNTMKEVASSTNPEQAVSRQQEYVQQVMHQTVGNAKEIMDMSFKSMMEVFDKVFEHTSHNVTAAMTQPKKSAPEK